MNEILRIQNLSKSFGPKRVLEDFNMSLEKGKVYGLLGVNGAGKTTLIRIIMGAIPKDSGEVVYKANRLKYNDTTYKREIGFIAEESVFFSWMTVQQLLKFNSSFYSTWNTAKVNSYLDRLDLSKKAKIKNMSRGMKLKLGLIVALGSEPEMLILDDPTSGLDVPTRHEFLKGILQEILGTGTTILFASHMVHELEGIIDQLGILHQGRLILEDEFQEIKNSVKRVRIIFHEDPPEKIEIEEALTQTSQHNRVEVVVYPWNEAVINRLEVLGPSEKEVESVSLEEIFVSFVSREGKKITGRK
jgi:ABC-2 type transport system ATP-binding protein